MKANYKELSREARLKVLDLIYNAQTSHIGSNFSCIDMLAVVFENTSLVHDRIILSKGWAAASFYFFLYKKERITKSQLDSYCQPDSKFIGLCEPVTEDIKVAGGSMGLGVPMAVGMALAKKLNNESGKVYVIMSDGELDCGICWEAFAIAKQNKLENLIVLCDNNGLQAMGRKEDILDLGSPAKKLREFGWFTEQVRGHDHTSVCRAIQKTVPGGKPRFIDCLTVKGKGVSFMEDNNEFHYRAPEEDEYLLAKQELHGKDC